MELPDVPRTYAPIYTSIWQDAAFTSLTGDAQRLYLLINSQPEITFCGVIIYSERRWARWASDSTAEAIQSALIELVDAGFAVWDDETDEVWIRSFIKHNKVIQQPKLLVAATRQALGIHSSVIRKMVTSQLSQDRDVCTPSDDDAALAVANPALVDNSQDDKSPGVSLSDSHPDTHRLSVSKALLGEPGHRTQTQAHRMGFAELFEEALRIVARRRAQARSSSKPIRDFEAWFANVRPDLASRFEARAKYLFGSRASLSPQQLADALEDRPTVPDVVAANAVAQQARLADGDALAAEVRDEQAQGTETHEVGKQALRDMRAAFAPGSESEGRESA